MKRSKSSQRWLEEHFSDHYVQLAQKEGYRSRAAYKLIEILEQDKLIKPGMTVVDLGSAPGSWSEVVSKRLKEKGRIIAMDILAMEPITGVDFLQGDFSEEETYQGLLKMIGKSPVDLVISDIAPNLSGIRSADQSRASYLVELALAFAKLVLKPGGCFVVKVFQGEGFDEILKDVRGCFKIVKVRKPKASRPRSTEVYFVASDFKV